ncbi:hypothetical protein EGW08_014465, partial [Elysia chlorotica]
VDDVSTNPSKTRPTSEREGSFHLPAIVATKSDVMNLRSRPGSSAGVSSSEQNTEMLLGDIQGSLADAVALRTKSVDLNNNEFESTSSNTSFNMDMGAMRTNHDSSPSRQNHNMENKRGVQKGKNEHAFRNESQPPADSDVGDNHAEHVKSSRKSTSTSAGLSSTPSTILSQVIIEEDETERQTRGTPSTLSSSPSHSNPRLSSRNGQGDRSDAGAYIQRLPPLKPHGKSSNSPNTPGGIASTGKELSNSGRNKSPLRSKPEFTDFSSTKVNRQSMKISDTAVSGGITKKHQEANRIPHNPSGKKDASNPHHNNPSSKESKEKSHRFSAHGSFSSGSISNHGDPVLDNPDHGSFLPSLSNQRGKKAGSDVRVFNGDCGLEGTTENVGTREDTYALPSAIGLPKVWKQSIEKKKDPRGEPEVSAAAIARKHRRSRMNSNSIFSV